MVVYLLFIFTASFVLSLTLTTIAIFLAPRMGFFDLPGDRKIHTQPIPYGGGIAIFITIYFLLIAGWVVLHFTPNSSLLEILKIHLKGLVSIKVVTQLLGILLGGLIIFITGLIDDIKGLSPKVKLLAGFVAASVVIYTGTLITAFVPLMAVNWVITALWIVGITNAFNLLDNMDGLCSGVAIIASAILMTICLQAGEIFVTAFIVLFLGSISGFWIYNYNPAKIFLGDSGSLLIGYFLSVITILPTFYDINQENAKTFSIFLPIIILAIPIFDTLSVIFIRIKNKKSIFEGDKNHFSHRLVSLGLSQQQAVLLIYLVCISTGISTLLLLKLDNIGSSLLLIQVIFIFLIIVILENAGRNKKKSE
jgi:UDP-GlcNAc:undecaprenyl-phosphate GlcNAc-1-phosphate transferase